MITFWQLGAVAGGTIGHAGYKRSSSHGIVSGGQLSEAISPKVNRPLGAGILVILSLIGWLFKDKHFRIFHIKYIHLNLLFHFLKYNSFILCIFPMLYFNNSLPLPYESDDACLIVDGTIVSKPYTDENDLISWHWDNSKNRNEKGINLLTDFYHTCLPNSSESLRIPVSFECVKKTVRFCDPQTGKEKRKSAVTKNEMMRSMLKTAVENQHLKFRYVLSDSWLSSTNDMLFIHKLEKYFVMDVKSNRLCMLATEDRNKGAWTNLDKLSLQPKQPVKIWIKDLEIPVFLCPFVFTNKDDSNGEMYLITNDLNLSAEGFQIAMKNKIYWKVWKMVWKQLDLIKNFQIA